MKISVQEYADSVVVEKYRQPLMTVREACAKVGWDFQGRPVCCGQPVELQSFIGDTYQAECEKCGRFILDVGGLAFKGSCAYFADRDKVDFDAAKGRVWIAGICAPSAVRRG